MITSICDHRWVRSNGTPMNRAPKYNPYKSFEMTSLDTGKPNSDPDTD